MSKKDFIALADAIRQHNKNAAAWQACGVQDAFSVTQLGTLAGFCAASNPLFKRDRWLNYIDGKCGPNGGAL